MLLEWYLLGDELEHDVAAALLLLRSSTGVDMWLPSERTVSSALICLASARAIGVAVDDDDARAGDGRQRLQLLCGPGPLALRTDGRVRAMRLMHGSRTAW